MMAGAPTATGLPGPVHFSACWKCGGTRFRFQGVKNHTRVFKCSNRACGKIRFDSLNDPGRQSSDLERHRACRLYRSGMNAPEIATGLGRNAKSIRIWLREAGILLRRGRPLKFRSYPAGCTSCGGEVVADDDYFICLDCGHSPKR